MSDMTADTLKSLIQLIPPAKALKEEVEKSIHLKLFNGTGDLAVQSYRGIHARVKQLVDDPYVENLVLDIPQHLEDIQKVSNVLIAISQLYSYLVGMTGLVGFGGGASIHIQTAPSIQGSTIQLPKEQMTKLLGNDFNEKSNPEAK